MTGDKARFIALSPSSAPALANTEGSTSETNPPAAAEAEPTPQGKRKVAEKKKNTPTTAKKKEEKEKKKTDPAIHKAGLCLAGPRAGASAPIVFLQGMSALPITLSSLFLFFSFSHREFSAVSAAGGLRGCDCFV